MGKTKVKGIHLEIGGDTTGLTKALSDVNKKARDIQGELREVDRSLKLDPTNTEVLAQKQKLLAESVGNAKEKLEALKKAKADVDKRMANGDTSTSAEQYRKLQREISDTTANLKKLEKESDQTSETLEKVGKAKKDISGLKSSFSSAAKGAAVLLGTVVAIGAALSEVEEETREYRTDLSKLKTNAEQAGKSFDGVKKQLNSLVAITDETDSSIEALSNLLRTNISETGLEKIVKELSGAVIAFPDTLKIESLADGLQETLATGNAVGQFSELLERCGMNIDVFNEGLKKSKKLGEEEQYILDTLSRTGMAKINADYVEANENLIKMKTAQQDWNDNMARAGELIAPIKAEVVSLGASLLSGAVDIVEGIAEIGDATADVRAINEALEETKNNFKSAIDESEVASEKIESWKQLKEKLDEGTLSSGKLKEAQKKVQEIEQWFIDNYGSYISAEEEKNGIRDETIDKLEKEFDTMSEIAKLELQTELVKNVDKIPEIEYETELLKGKTQALQEQNQALFDSKNKIALAQAEWNLFLASDGINDPEKTAEKVRELNAELEGTGLSIQDGNSASIQLDHALQRIGFRMEEVGKEISGNKTKIAEGEKTINAYKLGLETLASVAPEVVDSFRVTREGVEGEHEKQIIAMGGHFAQMQTDAENAYSGVTDSMLEESANQYNIATTEYQKIGKAIPDGMQVGIESGKLSLKAKVGDFITQLKSWFTGKDALDTHSPSKWSESIAAFVDDGLALGFIKNADKVQRSMRELFNMMEDERKAFTEDITVEEERYNKELERIRAEGTEQQNKAYLEGLKKLADEAKEKRDFIREQYEAAVEDIKDAISELEKEMESYKNGLSKTNLVGEDKYTFNFDGKETVHTVPVLADLSPKVKELETFIKNINSLKEMGIDETMIEQIQELGGEEGGMLAQALLNATPEMRDEFIKDFKRIGELSGEATAEVFQKELVSVADDLKAKMDELAPDLLQTGEDWGRYLGRGILNKLQEALNSVGVMADYSSPAGGSTVVNYNTSIENNIQATPNTANEVAEAQRRQIEDLSNWGQIS